MIAEVARGVLAEMEARLDSLRTDVALVNRYQLEVFERQIPLRRSGEEDDAKGVAVFLASEASRFVTGITLIVDGGTICHGNPALG